MVCLISNIINKQDMISKMISQNILLYSKEIKTQMKNEMMKVIYFDVVIIFILVFLILYIYNGINNGIEKILLAISFISKNEINDYKSIEIDTNDELKVLANIFNQMVFELKERNRESKEINQKLITAKELAEKNSKEKSEFLANMSHEIRTPLNAIVGFIEILKEDEKDKTRLEYLNIVNSSSYNLLGIINSILDFSKIENSKIQLDLKNTNLLEELEQIINLFKSKIKDKQINFIVNINENLPTIVKTDMTKLRQILINLIGNAIKFTKINKSIEVNIKLQQNKLSVRIIDEGIGIAKDKQKEIFEPYRQADNSITREYGGTGLGLVISKRFVDALGGTLQLKSEFGTGSEFFFAIPIEIVDDIAQVKSEISFLDTLNGHILVVEDNQANQVFMKLILKKMNLTFEIVNDGVEAIESFKNSKYDLILMDENMPRLSGIEATKKIIEFEKENHLTHTPIIALTANALVGDKARFLKAGMDEYITKPIDNKILHEMLKVFLNSKEHYEK